MARAAIEGRSVASVIDSGAVTGDADEQLASLPLARRMAAAHRLALGTNDETERAALLSAALWPTEPPPLTPERAADLGRDVWIEPE